MASPRPPPRPQQFAASLETDAQTAHRLADTFAERFADDGAASIVDAGRGRWRVTLYVSRAIEPRLARELAQIAASALRFRRIAAADWVGKSLAGLKPVEAGRFVVHGAHDRARIAPNRIGIEIEAALAFGTGHHGTTRGCLLALDRICKAWSRAPVHRHPEARAKGAPRRMSGRGARAVALRGSLRSHLRVTARGPRILDLGTGSGVLAIAAARALRRRVLATDIDPQAVDAARKNARRNGVGPLVDVRRADGAAGWRRRAPFDLVFANILLQPLQRLAAELTRLTAPGARVVLSGILPAQANAIIAAYRGLTLQRRIDLDGWTTLVFARATTLPPRRRSC
jgi:ribosomal protein L11 methyltransferase